MSQAVRRVVGLASVVTFLAAPPARPSGETVNKTLGTLPPGKTVVVRFRATVDNPFPIASVQVSTQGTVSGSNFGDVLTDDPDTGGAADATLTPVAAAPDLAITKTDGVASTAGGQALLYALGVTNVGNQAAASVMVTETVPADTTFDATASTPGWSCLNGSGPGTLCTYTLGMVPVSAIAIPLNFAVRVVATPAGPTIVNTATVEDDGTNGPDPDLSNNSATDTDGLGPMADLSITKTNGRTQVVSGAVTVYTITVGNAGPAGVVGATVTDTPPAALTAVTWTCAPAGGASCAPSGSGGINAAVDLPVGSSLVYKLKARLDPAATGSLSNTASVAVPSGTSDPSAANNSATDTDPIISRPVKDDFDNDGRSDVVLYDTVTGEARLWKMNGIAHAEVSLGVQPNLNARIVGFGDYDGDGQRDLLWQDQTTFAVSLWLSGTTTGPALPAPPFAGPVVGSGDYDGDGVSDILWQNPATREVVLWAMGPSGLATAQTVGTTGPDRSFRASEDYNADGRSDLFLMNGSTLTTQLRFMDGFNPSIQQATNASALAGFDVVGTSHFSADPSPLVVWHVFKAHQPEIWMINGTSVTRGLTSKSKTGPIDVVGTGDYDGDGHGDVLWYNHTSTVLRLWRMNGFNVVFDGEVGTVPSPAADWIVVRPR